MVDNIYPFNTQEEAEKHRGALRESLQDTKKLCIEAEPKPNASIYTEVESEEIQREQKRQQKCHNCQTESSLSEVWADLVWAAHWEFSGWNQEMHEWMLSQPWASPREDEESLQMAQDDSQFW